jgi:AcrR family transcriptional regulator
MARPDIREQRREQILDAFERCIAMHGVAGAGLDMIAKEAGLARALIRHNVGNREDLLKSAVSRFTTRTTAEWQDTLRQMPRRNRYETLIEWLFDPKYSDPQMVRISDALITACAAVPELAGQIRNWLTGFSSSLAADIRANIADIDQADSEAVAAGIIAAYFSYDSTTPLGDMEAYRQSCKRAALMLAERAADGSQTA